MDDGSMLVAMIIPALIYGAVFGVACSYLAEAKGRNGTNWAIAGVFFGVIALLALVGYPSQKTDR
jgi:hypothetical protein